MPVTTIKATAGMYGNSNNAAYTNTATNHLYVGYTGGSGFHYRSYLKFPSLKTIAAIGNSAITITQVKLFCRRTDGGSTTITGGPSSSAAWNAALTGSLNSASWSASTEWKSVTITNSASLAAIAGYTGAWYIHLRGTANQNYIRLASTGTSYVPYIQVTWEYSQSTVTFTDGNSQIDSLICNGSNTATISIDSSIYSSDSKYTLVYSIGDQSGTIVSNLVKTGGTTTATWTPGTELLSEITNAETGDVNITLTAYNSSGAVFRTEKAVLSLGVPSSVKMACPSQLVQVINGYGNYGLTGRTTISIRPVVSEANLYGAQLVQAVATITQPGGSETEITWNPDEFEEYNNNTLIGTAKSSSLLTEDGNVIISIEAVDSRGRNADMTGYSASSVTILAYAPPEIELFDVDRISAQLNENDEIIGYTQDDTGAYGWANLSATLHSLKPNGVTEEQTCSFTLAVTNTSTNTVVGTRTGTLTLTSAAVTLTNNYSLVFPVALGTPPTFDIGSAFEFAITITDATGVSVIAYSTIVPGRANMHLAGSKYGVAFGGFSKGTEQSPLLESYYPAVFYNGIKGVTDYSTEEQLTGGTWINGKPIYQKTLQVQVPAGTRVTASIDSTVEYIIDYHGFLAASNGYQRPLNWYYSTSAYCNVWKEAAYSLISLQSFEAGTVYVTIFYTKTTDTPITV